MRSYLLTVRCTYCSRLSGAPIWITSDIYIYIYICIYISISISIYLYPYRAVHILLAVLWRAHLDD